MNGTVQPCGRITYRERCVKRCAMHCSETNGCFSWAKTSAATGGCFAVSKGLLRNSVRSGSATRRSRNRPLPARGLVRRWRHAPIVEIMTVNFQPARCRQILNTAATYLHMSGGLFNVPLVIRMAPAAAKQLAAQHSTAWKDVCAHPGNQGAHPGDAGRCARHALDRPGGPGPGAGFSNTAPLQHGRRAARRCRTGGHSTGPGAAAGRDITIITYGASLFKALDARKRSPGRESKRRWSICAHCGAGRSDFPGFGGEDHPP